MIRTSLLVAGAAACALSLTGCVTAPAPRASTSTLPIYPSKTSTQQALNAIPAPARPVAVAVYGFTDQTGQFKTQSTGQTLSRAITQGGGSSWSRRCRTRASASGSPWSSASSSRTS